MEYVCLIYTAEGAGEDDPDLMPAYAAFGEEVASKGVMGGGNRLRPIATATTVRVRGGNTSTMDGPYVETKEQLGGYFILDCKDLDEAIAYAAKIPGAKQVRRGSSDLGYVGPAESVDARTTTALVGGRLLLHVPRRYFFFVVFLAGFFAAAFLAVGFFAAAFFFTGILLLLVFYVSDVDGRIIVSRAVAALPLCGRAESLGGPILRQGRIAEAAKSGPLNLNLAVLPWGDAPRTATRPGGCGVAVGDRGSGRGCSKRPAATPRSRWFWGP